MPSVAGEQQIGESIASKRSAAVLGQMGNLGQSVKYSSMAESLPQLPKVDQQSPQSDEIEEDIADEAGSPIEESIKESIHESAEKSLANVRRVIGSEQTIQNQTKDILKAQDRAGAASPFDKNTFQNYTNQQYKNIALAGEDQMSSYIEQIHDAVVRKQKTESEFLKKELDNKRISPRTFNSRRLELEKWVQREQNELQIKQASVKSAVEDIKGFVGRLEEERKLTLDAVLGAQQPAFHMSDSEHLGKLKDELAAI